MQTLSEFVNEEAESLTAFADYWKAQSLVNPERYPAILGPGEWDEQFRLFQEGHA